MLAALVTLVVAVGAAQEPTNPSENSIPYVRDPSGVFTRIVFRTREAGLNVELRRLSLGPGKSAKAVRFDGGAVLEVFSGEGTVILAQRKERLKLGSKFSVDEGASFDLVNNGERPLLLRALVVSSEAQ